MPELFESFDNSETAVITGIPFEETIEGQTGWKRPYPKAICQDPEILESVTAFTYDIHDDAFVDYFESRSCWSLRKAAPNSEDSPEILVKRRKILDADAATPVEPAWIQSTKAQLQDCWELYKAK